MTRRSVLASVAGGGLLFAQAVAEGRWADNPVSDPYTTDGDLRLILTGAVAKKGRAQKDRSDLELDLERRGGIWETEGWGFAFGYNTADHYGPVSVLERGDRFTVEVRFTMGSDPWVPGSAARYTLTLKRRDNRFEGTYTGVFDTTPISGKVRGTFRKAWPLLPPSGFIPIASGEHPRLVFRRADLNRLRQRAATDWGQTVLGRLRELLTGDFVYEGDYGANSAYFAAGYGFLYALTDDPAALQAAREITAKTMPIPPSSKGHQYAYSHPLMGLALAYDFCYHGWDDSFRRTIARYLEETSALVIAGKGKGFNHSPGSNWVARTRGAAGLALTAIDSDAGTTPNAAHLRKIAERSMARYLVCGTGEQGFGPEGDGYHVESMEMVLGMMQAYRTAFGQEMARENGAEWLLPLSILRSFPGADGQPLLHRYGRHGDATRDVSGTLFGLGLGSVSETHQPAVRQFYDSYWGLLGDGTFGIESPHIAPFVLALYPDTVRPQPPTVILPRTLHDERKGFCLFRTEEFVTTVYAKSDAQYGWNFPDAGTFRIHGFGTDWAIRAGVGTREQENIVVVRNGDLPGNGTGRITHFEDRPDGSGAVSMVLDEVYREGRERKDLGIRSFRAFAVDYSGECGAPALFVLVDRASGGTEQAWLWHTAGKSVRQEGNGFVIEGRDGATLHGTFVTPSPVRLSCTTANGIHTIRAVNDDRKNAEFFVIVTIQRNAAPPVTVQGRGLSAKVTVGKQEIQYQAPRPPKTTTK